MEIMVFPWDRYQNVAWLNWLMGFQPFPSLKWITTRMTRRKTLMEIMAKTKT